jgi:hypothetical protein
MGPFSPSTSRVEEIMEDDMKCNLPGFEGEFFDPNDVEGYLRGQGLDIAPAAEFVTGEINLAELGEAPSPKSSTSDSVASMISPKTPRTSVDSMLLDAGRDVMVANFDFPRSEVESSKAQTCLTFPLGNFSSWDNDTSMKENNDFIDPIFSTMAGQKSGTATPDISKSSGRRGATQRVTLNVKVLLDGESSAMLRVYNHMNTDHGTQNFFPVACVWVVHPDSDHLMSMQLLLLQHELGIESEGPN